MLFGVSRLDPLTYVGVVAAAGRRGGGCVRAARVARGAGRSGEYAAGGVIGILVFGAAPANREDAVIRHGRDLGRRVIVYYPSFRRVHGLDSPSHLFRCTIAPWLSVQNGARAVDFYKSAFGANEVYRLEDPSGAVVARLSVDGAEFWLSGESPQDGKFGPESSGGGSVRMILTVADPDAVFAQAVRAGATEVFPVDEEHGWRLGRVVDPFGFHWEIGRPVAD